MQLAALPNDASGFSIVRHALLVSNRQATTIRYYTTVRYTYINACNANILSHFQLLLYHAAHRSVKGGGARLPCVNW